MHKAKFRSLVFWLFMAEVAWVDWRMQALHQPGADDPARSLLSLGP